MEEQLVVFRLQKEAYGLPIEKVKEIIRPVVITQIPHTPEHVEGVINLRGGIIPVIDLKKFFGFYEQAQEEKDRIIIVEMAGQDVGVRVDAVEEVLRIKEESIEPPSQQMGELAGYVRGIGKIDKRLLVLLDLDKVMD